MEFYSLLIYKEIFSHSDYQYNEAVLFPLNERLFNYTFLCV